MGQVGTETRGWFSCLENGESYEKNIYDLFINMFFCG